ncbi:MAG: WYL domain-containing protein [Lachnospiraceae bacterium]|nr:WYL domain-containing protein [Lachnospiraceae bacterium]
MCRDKESHTSGECAFWPDFSFDIRPTDDFLSKLFSYRDGIEILEPSDLREKMEQLIAKTLNRYSVKNSL